MNKKSLLGLLFFTCIIMIGLYIGADYMVRHSSSETTKDKSYALEEGSTKEDNINDSTDDVTVDDQAQQLIEDENDAYKEILAKAADNILAQESQLSDNSVNDMALNPAIDSVTQESWLTNEGEEALSADSTEGDVLSATADNVSEPQLIYNAKDVDYMSYIPELIIDSELEQTLDISNPDISIDAKAAILFDADTKEVLYHKSPVEAVFPASTIKLLTSLVALDWCDEEEQVTIGDEITMIASDSTRAYLKEGEILTIRDLMAAMLLPSGNDAAYAVATYVGRKSLDNMEATKEEAVIEFVRLMNKKAAALGVKNSCFKTPDGYDAIGQYTTAYDMGLIGIAAAQNDTITEISCQSSSRNIFVSGEDVTWTNTNKLIKQYSGQFYSHAVGLKTGTSTIAGRCIVAAAECDGKKVVCAVMDSTSTGRWEDAIALLKYGLEKE